MAPMHVVPDPAMRIVLVKEMRAAAEATEAVGIVHPAERGAEMIAVRQIRRLVGRVGVDDRDAGFQHVRRREPVGDRN